MSKQIVAIIGRPNVGKSTLFNRILQTRRAIVDDMPGVTRDRHYAEADWAGHEFILTDTGGIIPSADGGLELTIREQAEIAVAEAHVIVFMTDIQVGVLDEDKQIARYLQATNKPVIVAVNKVDNEKLELEYYEFYELGLGDPMPISAQHSRYVGDFLDKVVSYLRPDAPPEKEEELIRVAVIGRPNVGKSSLVNRLLGHDRHIVDNVPGTTRDSIHSRVKYYGKEYLLIDTAGLRKRTKVQERVEYFSTLRTQKAVQECDLAVVMLDATEGILSQDVNVAKMAADERVGVILAVNKWDAVEKDTKTADHFKKQIEEKLPFLTYAPVMFISALSGQRVTKVYEQIDLVHAALHKRVQTSELNQLLEEIVAKNHPPASHGKYIKIFYGTQRSVKPPTFVLFSNYPEFIPKNYIRYLENQLRAAYDFTGAPFRIHFQKRRRGLE